jgi:hypothetical protein
MSHTPTVRRPDDPPWVDRRGGRTMAGPAPTKKNPGGLAGDIEWSSTEASRAEWRMGNRNEGLRNSVDDGRKGSPRRIVSTGPDEEDDAEEG